MPLARERDPLMRARRHRKNKENHTIFDPTLPLDDEETRSKLRF
jgi:hypothetical protein